MPSQKSKASEWLAQCLSDERLFGDGPPVWRYLPTSADALSERIRRSRLLKKHNLSKVGFLLARCAPRARCASGACPECGRALQRLFTKEAQRLLQPHDHYEAVSVVGRTHRRGAELNTLNISTFTAQLFKLLREGGAGIVMGGIDFSFNEYPTLNLHDRWAPQFWLLVRSANRPHWERLIREFYRSNTAVPRPIKVKTWNGNIRAPGYALKTNFRRRISVSGSRFARGHNSVCRNTKPDRLRAHERVELYRYLHEIGLEARIVLVGIDKVTGGFDVAD
jgi:hypothetical protein